MFDPFKGDGRRFKEDTDVLSMVLDCLHCQGYRIVLAKFTSDFRRFCVLVVCS